MNTSAPTSKSLLNYFLLVVVLSVPFWLIGGNKLPIPVNLPVSALMFINPVIAASILSYKRDGFNGTKELFKKAAIWHSIPYVQAHNPAYWIVWQCLWVVATRILIVWIYNNTGKSVFAAILVHDMSNVSWSLFPNYASHYDPFVTGIITWLIAVIVIFLWGPETLARYRYARLSGSDVTLSKSG